MGKVILQRLKDISSVAFSQLPTPGRACLIIAGPLPGKARGKTGRIPVSSHNFSRRRVAHSSRVLCD